MGIALSVTAKAEPTSNAAGLVMTNYDARRADLYLTVLAVAAIGMVALLLFLR
jgi:hypothetical protein